MADDKKITGLAAATLPLAGTEKMEIVQGGVNKQVDVSEVGGGGAVDSVNGQTGVVVLDAGDIDFTPAGNISATDVQAAIEELDSDLSAHVIDQASPSTAGGTITLDMNSQIQRSFVGSATFAAAKILALSNTTNSLFFNFIFEVTNIAAVITMPSDFLMADFNFDGTDWTPPATGKYELGGSFDDVNNVWYVKIAGPFI